MKVRATQIGYFEHLRRRIDDVFTIPDEPRRKLRDRVEMEHEEVIDGAGAVAKIPKKRFPVDGPLTKSIVDKKARSRSRSRSAGCAR
jgi:hypothetical protein